MPRWLVLTTLVLACWRDPLVGLGDGSPTIADAPTNVVLPVPDAANDLADDRDSFPDSAPVMADAAPAPPEPDAAESLDVGPGPACPSAPASDFHACSADPRLRNDFYRRKGPYQCGLCTITPAQTRLPVSGCFMGDLSPALYCAATCDECCYPDQGAPCTKNTDCCGMLCLFLSGGGRCGKEL